MSKIISTDELCDLLCCAELNCVIIRQNDLELGMYVYCCNEQYNAQTTLASTRSRSHFTVSCK